MEISNDSLMNTLQKHSEINESGCILWTGYKNKTGYGLVNVGKKGRNKWLKAHRIAWELNYGPIPNGICVCHKCDVRNCINPEHLFLGTKADNNHDRWKKGRRGNIVSGEEHPNSKLNWTKIKFIRSSVLSQRKLSIITGVGKSEIGRIKSNKYWIEKREEP
jgi:hypothetical protein